MPLPNCTSSLLAASKQHTVQDIASCSRLPKPKTDANTSNKKTCPNRKKLRRIRNFSFYTLTPLAKAETQLAHLLHPKLGPTALDETLICLK